MAPLMINNQSQKKHEQFLALLKTQYGYTNDKAVDEMKRILMKFHAVNKSLSFHRPRRA
jgi:hypothetical protein